MDLQPPSPLVQTSTFSSLFVFTKKELRYGVFFLFLLFFSFLLLNSKPPFPAILNIGLISSVLLPKNSLDSGSKTCDYSYGKWVRDESLPVALYTEKCPFLDPGFRCHENGREDYDFLKWRWQPHGCDLPRFNANELLERSRNGRIVFVGDSIGRNQWESLICMLAQAVLNQSTIYEENGNPITKHKGFLSMRFHDYNLTVEYYRSPFLVSIDHPPRNSSSNVRKVIQVDQLDWHSNQWIGADVLVFNAGHWWNKEKTAKMGCFFEEGGRINITMNVMEAFDRSLQTWKSWAVQNLDPAKTFVLFRSYSPTHFRNGTWDNGGTCDTNTEPETNTTTMAPEPKNNIFVRETIEELKNVHQNAQVLNITYLTEFRKDGHPSNHREPDRRGSQYTQDCSHWCLPGVPDIWNELLYAHLLQKGYGNKATR